MALQSKNPHDMALFNDNAVQFMPMQQTSLSTPSDVLGSDLISPTYYVSLGNYSHIYSFATYPCPLISTSLIATYAPCILSHCKTTVYTIRKSSHLYLSSLLHSNTSLVSPDGRGSSQSSQMPLYKRYTTFPILSSNSGREGHLQEPPWLVFHCSGWKWSNRLYIKEGQPIDIVPHPGVPDMNNHLPRCPRR